MIMAAKNESKAERPFVASVKKADRRPCVVCGQAVESKFRPFCSARCADVDLYRWLSGGYRIPSQEAPSERDAGAGEESEEF